MDTMKLTMTCENAVDMLHLFSMLTGSKMPPKVGFIIARNIAVLRVHPDVIACDAVRSSLLTKYGKDNGDGTITVPTENGLLFTTEYRAVCRAELDLVLTPLPLQLLDFMPDLALGALLVIDRLWEIKDEAV